MRNVTVKKTELLERLEENRSNHRGIFLKAQEGYRAAVIKELDRMLEDAREGRDICTYVNLVAPEDHTDDYNRVIEMLQMHTEDTVELATQEFENYVRDRWGWANTFAASTEAYIGGSDPGSVRRR